MRQTQEDWFKSEKFKRCQLENAKKGGVSSHERAQKREEEYLKNPKLCQECGSSLPYYDHNDKKFCSSSCAAKYNNEHRDFNPAEDKRTKTINCAKCGVEIIVNIRSGFGTKCKECHNLHYKKYTTIKKVRERKTRERNIENYKAVCIYCGKDFISLRSKNVKRGLVKYCSPSCASKHGHKNGTIPSWTTRPIKSYPERFFEKVLNNNKIPFEINKPIWCEDRNYFLDFYIADKNIDLEIDGKQHGYPERIIHDLKRDAYLKQKGYIVYRIKWKNINKQAGKNEIKMSIQNFLDFYKKA